MENVLNSGVLLIDKTEGTTSRHEGNVVSKILQTGKIGHVGTLDPFATGLLLILVNKGTKLSQFLLEHNKTYIASLKLGVATDTGDLTGNKIEEKPVICRDFQKINEVLQSFLGDGEQIPPMYSSIKINGQILYKLARKGIEVERKKRHIKIDSIKLLNFKDDIIEFEATVSSGTYIRTLGEDIAKKLGTVGHLVALRRTSIGDLKVEGACKSNEASYSRLISIEKALDFIPHYYLKDEEKFKAHNGVSLIINSNEKELLIMDEEKAIAVYQKKDDNVYTCLRGLL